MQTSEHRNPTNGGETTEDLAVAHGIASHQRVVTQRDEYKIKWETAEKLIAVYKIEVEGLRAQLAAESSRVQSYQQERDDAVAKLAKYETMFTSFYSQMRAFSVKHDPIIKPTDDEPYGG